MWRHHSILLLASMILGCPPAAIDDDVVRPKPGAPFLEELPGPLLGPFNSFTDALVAACRKIITKPHAVSPHPSTQDFNTYWRTSTEYCAWIYYTPDGNYELSKLTDQSKLGLATRKKMCLLPPTVQDQRYSPSGIKYICALHNHLFDDALSADDLRFILNEGARRGAPPYFGFFPQTREGGRLLSIVAFFSTDAQSPSCDGYYQYFPLIGVIVKVTHGDTKPRCEQFGLVEWDDAFKVPTIKEVKGPCPE
jgi:hypothetical protein